MYRMLTLKIYKFTAEIRLKTYLQGIMILNFEHFLNCFRFLENLISFYLLINLKIIFQFIIKFVF